MKFINFAHMKQKLLLLVSLLLLVGCSGTVAVDSLHAKYASENWKVEIVKVSDPIDALLKGETDMALVSLSKYEFYKKKGVTLKVYSAGNDTLRLAFANSNDVSGNFSVAVPDSSYLLRSDFPDSTRFVVAEADSIPEMILSGEVTAGLCADDSRLSYGEPYLRDSMVFLEIVEEKRGKIIYGTEDLDGMTVIVETGSVQELYASAYFTKSQVVMVDALPDLFLQLRQNKSDAVLVAQTIWKMVSRDYPDIYSVCDTIDPNPVAVVFSKEEPELRKAFNAFQKKLNESGELQRMKDDWYNPDSDRKMPEIDGLDFPNGDLNIAYYSCVPPFNFIKDGKPCGSEVELVTRFAISMGMRPIFSDMSFTSIIPYVQSGRAKMATSTFSVTEERSKQVDFADPWLYEASSLLVSASHAPDSLLSTEMVDKKTFREEMRDSFVNNLITESRWKLFVDGLKATILISLFSAVFGTLLGILLCFMSMSKKKVMSATSSVFIEFMRRMPQVVLLMILFYVVFADVNISGEWVAVVGFTMCFGAYTSVMFRSAVESIDKGQKEAGLSMGFDKLKTFYYFILPQVIMRVLPVYKGEFIGLVKATSIVGYIAVLDLTKAGDIVRSRTFEAFFPLILITVMYFLVIWLLSVTIKYFQFRSRPKRQKYLPKNIRSKGRR